MKRFVLWLGGIYLVMAAAVIALAIRFTRAVEDGADL